MISGSFADILDVLTAEMNFTFTLRPPEDGAWGGMQDDGSWNGMMGLVERMEVDIGRIGSSLIQPNYGLKNPSLFSIHILVSNKSQGRGCLLFHSPESWLSASFHQESNQHLQFHSLSGTSDIVELDCHFLFHIVHSFCPIFCGIKTAEKVRAEPWRVLHRGIFERYHDVPSEC